MEQILLVKLPGVARGSSISWVAELKGKKFRMQAVKTVVAELRADRTASFCKGTSGREVIGR